VKLISTLLASLVFAGTAVGFAVTVDSYGAGTSRECSKATGYFHTEKDGGRWSLCTPEGHPFFVIGVDAVFPSRSAGNDGQSYYQQVVAKYGNAEGSWAEATTRRLQQWGFNTLGTYASPYIEPTYLARTQSDNGGRLLSRSAKLPFIALVRPGYYAMKNQNGYVAEPVKNITYGISRFYAGYSPSGGVPDYFDTKLAAWLDADLTKESYWMDLRRSPYLPYLIGIACEDGDQSYGFGPGDQYPTLPSPGYNHAHLGWIVATIAPTQTADESKRAVYADTAVHAKLAWRDLMKAKYGTIAALNAAWGSSYSTFDSSGTPVINEYVSTGDGKKTRFLHRFSLLSPARLSVQFKLGSKVIAGDTNASPSAAKIAKAEGQIFGPEVHGYIDYGTGIAILEFTKAPAPGLALTVNYVQNGWGIGTGLLDEDGRPQHQKWLGKDSKSLADSSPAVKPDLNSLLRATAGQSFKTCRAGIKTAFPKTLYLGPDALGGYGAPPRAEVLQAAAESIDVMLLSGTGGFSQNILDFIEKYSGDKPFIETNFRAANPDSEFASVPMDAGVPGFSSQDERGRDYEQAMARVRDAASSSGSHPYVGMLWWQYADNLGEKLNWGLVTRFDNAYDGHEDVMQHVACSAPLQKDACGGEHNDYGDVISAVQRANLSQSQ
jgi:hypothetical protein